MTYSAKATYFKKYDPLKDPVQKLKKVQWVVDLVMYDPHLTAPQKKILLTVLRFSTLYNQNACEIAGYKWEQIRIDRKNLHKYFTTFFSGIVKKKRTFYKIDWDVLIQRRNDVFASVVKRSDPTTLQPPSSVKKRKNIRQITDTSVKYTDIDNIADEFLNSI